MQILQLVLIDVGVKANKLAHWAVSTLTIILLLSGFLQLQAQNVCVDPKYPKGNFSLDKDKVCVGSAVKVNAPPVNSVEYGYNFQYDGKAGPVDIKTVLTTTFTYNQPGSFTVVQVGTGPKAGTILCKEVVVLPVDLVKFTAKGCSNRRAVVTIDPSTLGQYDIYEIVWDDGVREQKTRADVSVNLFHTYNVAKSYNITVQGIYNAPSICPTAVTNQRITVTSAATQPVITSLKTTSDNSIDIAYQTGNELSVQLYQKVNGTYSATGQRGSGSGTFSAQTDAKQVQCFQVVAQDACSTAGLASDEVCSMVLSVSAVNKQNNLSWQPYAGTASQFRYYRIYRNGSVNGQVTNRTAGTYADANNINCGIQYCYSLEAHNGPTIITSQPVCATGINSNAPDSLDNVVVSIENNRPRLVAAIPTMSTPMTYTLVISRSNGPSGPFQQVGTVANRNTFVDDSADPAASSYCYQVAYQSNCGLTSKPSKPVCTVLLSSKTNTGIDWTVDSPFTPELVDNYILEVVDSLNGTKKEIPISGNTHYEPDPNDPNLQSQRYRIIAVSTSGTISYSNFFTFRREVKILVPDAFSPNGDGMNETFLAKGIYFDQYRLVVYDRWGEVVYTTTDKTQGWDGKIKEQLAAQGQYMYRIEVTDLTGFQTVRTGAVLLVR